MSYVDLLPWSLLLAILIPFTYIWLLCEAYRPYGYGSAERQSAAKKSAGQLFKHRGLTVAWSVSAACTTLAVLTGYLLFLINAWTDTFDDKDGEKVYVGVFGFMASALLWAPIVFLVGLNPWPSLIEKLPFCGTAVNPWPSFFAVLPVWGTAVFNIFILVYLPDYLGSDRSIYILYYIPWSVSALHHAIMDGIIWGWGFFGLWGVTGFVNTPKQPVPKGTKFSLHMKSLEKKPFIKF